ncbi:efflux transporter outer membrane subunit [Rhizorhapis sp. SPR117]|uniref:efflux transporter outer membrane subunit n=1 Tax=Rhizorhapis sp. SPR117 TaxID=2912611 RepID=UPI001EFF99AB|nr:efflux transporter outer membrane subunit [Rhizorhapis sp. SPR117]
MKRSVILALPLLISACAVGPDYAPPSPPPPAALQLQEAVNNPLVTQGDPAGHWWRLFDDAVLDRLVEKALVHNSDVRIAAANLQQARALLSEAGAARLPTSDASARATESRSSAYSSSSGTNVRTDYYSVGFDASYEVDLFGRVHRSVEAARGDVGAAAAGLDAAQVSVAAETARTYAVACGFAAQAKTARQTVELQQKTLDLTQRMFAGGRGTRRDVDQASVLVEQARAQIATFEAERRAAIYALAVLTGDPPAMADRQAAACDTPPSVEQTIPVGDGQALLARRPDVRQAERQLAADTARIGVATAALYPSINLLGSVALGAPDVGKLGTSDSLSWSAGPLISFNFPFNGAARAKVRQSKAVAAGSLAAFDKAVLTALGETEQALARLAGAMDREAALGRALSASNSAASISERRFQNGADSFLQLLDAQRSRATARSALAEAQTARAQAQVSLFKALGGGWEDAPQPEGT